MTVNKLQAFFAGTLNRSLLAAALITAPAVSTVVVNEVAPEASGWLQGSVMAQELIRPSSTPPETRRIPGISQRLNEELSEVQSFIDPEEDSGREPDLNEALRLLQEMERNIGEYNAYEQAQIYNFVANVHFQMDNMDRTIDAFEKVVARSPQIPSGLETSTWQVLGKLHMQEENFDAALDAFENWTNMVTSIDADQYYVFSLLFYQMGDADRALVHVNEAVEMAEQDGEVPEENWYAMQRLLYFEKEDYRNTLNVLKKMVRDYPKVSTWRQLSDMYSLLEEFDNRLHSLEVVYLLDGLDKENILVSMASMYLDRDIPYKAAKVLEKGIYEDEIIEPTSRNLELLANAWSMAQEVEKSMVEMEKAAEKSDEGDLFARLSAIYMLNDRYEDSIDAAREALDKGVERADQVYLRMGTAYVNLEQYDDAIETLKEAAKDKRSEEAAKQWISFAEKEKAREEKARKEEERYQERKRKWEEEDGLVLPGA
ncbi:tetratricopeptide repeat protein [Marinimicrobium koreense]|jgi:tetratricopeptide (TPR) repeat protein|uniref:Tetratricopeptide repeat protein n=1 Tax=Marinimicrobium koreense TaxID=306545 RepID=A0A3N1P2B8_9GAMM|nr:tetratricopeptide repeat protein [Marinimicrobium sp. UBA4509]ROQ21377.1 tetratricopeptide repeat protein [Marinimicrobium koreense]|tara:strand:+ start:39 stop:1493 length:1455 start_codon:yes stop_codon:yes gene_type:complete